MQSFDYKEYISFDYSEGSIQSALIDKIDYLNNSGLEGYKAELLNTIQQKKFNEKDEKTLIEQSVPKNFNDYAKKSKKKAFYEANALCFVDVIGNYMNKEFIKNENLAENSLRKNADILHELLFDSIYLLKLYDLEINENSNSKYELGKNPIVPPHDIYSSLLALVDPYNNHNGSTDVYMSINFIRQAIETKIRSAFDVFGQAKNCEGSFHLKSFDVSQILEVLSNFKKDIKCVVDIDVLNRIYSWSNIFVHTGAKTYSWQPIKITSYIGDFITYTKKGIKKNDGYINLDINLGISLKETVYKEIIENLKLKLKEEYDLIKFGKKDVYFLEEGDEFLDFKEIESLLFRNQKIMS